MLAKSRKCPPTPTLSTVCLVASWTKRATSRSFCAITPTVSRAVGRLRWRPRRGSAAGPRWYEDDGSAGRGGHQPVTAPLRVVDELEGDTAESEAAEAANPTGTGRRARASRRHIPRCSTSPNVAPAPIRHQVDRSPPDEASTNTEAPIWRYPHGTTAGRSGADDRAHVLAAFRQVTKDFPNFAPTPWLTIDAPNRTHSRHGEGSAVPSPLCSSVRPPSSGAGRMRSGCLLSSRDGRRPRGTRTALRALLRCRGCTRWPARQAGSGTTCGLPRRGHPRP